MKHRWHPRTGRQTRRVQALGQGIGTDRRTNDPHVSRSLPSLSLAGQDAGRLTGTFFGNGVSTGKVLRSGDRGTTRQRIPASRPRGNHWRGCSESDCGYGGEWDRFSFPWIRDLEQSTPIHPSWRVYSSPHTLLFLLRWRPHTPRHIHHPPWNEGLVTRYKTYRS
uniref:Uncharacterized protein n=1 Tax=Candidatus Kentrum sp. TC TaxID=2126339 RepID=A0A450YRM0_9GAMM|nr:MAG: hypothetical protein BECKTC1821E_GA0114239_10324 [Candidatus Kentron sp. TC]